MLKIKNTNKIDIIGGNIAGASFAIECMKKNIPFTIYEKEIFAKPCGGGFGEVFLDFFKENQIKVKRNFIKTSTFASRYFKLENIPFEVYVAKRRNIQEALLKKIPEDMIKFEQVTRKSVKKMSKLLVVATGINGLSKYLLQKNFPNLGKFQYSFFNEDTLKNWQFDEMLWYVIPELKGYAWIFPSTDGDIDVGIGGLISKNQDLHFKKFLAYVQKNFKVKIKHKNKKNRMISWGIPMWSNNTSKKYFNYHKALKKYCVGIGDAIDSVQIVSAGGIENALLTSKCLLNSISVHDSDIKLDLKSYEKDLFTKLPLPSHPIAIRMIDKITQSNKLLNTTLAVTKATYPLMDRLFSRIFYEE